MTEPAPTILNNPPVAEPTPPVEPAPTDPPAEPTPPVDLGLKQFLAGDLAVNETLGRFKDVPALANSYLELNQKLGGSIIKPGKEATPEEIAKYHRALGAPEKAAEYGLKHDAFENIPMDEDTVGKFMEIGHANGLNPEQMKSIFNWYGTSIQDHIKADVDTINTAHAEQDAALQKDWGGKYDSNKASVGAIAKSVFSPETMAFFEENRVGDNIPFMKDMLALAGTLGENSINGTTDGPSTSPITPISLKDESKELMGSSDYWKNEAKQRRVKDIFEQIEKLTGKG